MDVSQYLGVFLDEAHEHVQTLSDQLMVLENDPENEDSINEIFRAAHSLKGMAGTMGYKRMQKLTHVTEDVFSAVRSGQMKVTGGLVDVLFQALDAIEAYVDNVQNTSDEGTEDNEGILEELNKILQEGTGDVSSAGGAAAPAAEAAAPAAEAAPAGGSDEKALYKAMKLDDSQISTMKDAIVAGQHVYGATVYIDENCLLKAARAFLVFKAIEEFGEVAAVEPSSQDIEDERFEFHFSMFVVTEETLDKVIEAAKSVSEIVDVVGEEYNEEMLSGSTDAAEEAAPAQAAAPAAEEAAPAAEAAAPAAKAPEAKKAAAAKPTGKAVTNRTVRVDIEKLDVLMNLVSELIIAKNSIVSAGANMGQKGSESNMDAQFNEHIEYLESVTTNLHESVMKVRMVPIENALQKFPRMIRDLEKSLGKQMTLTITGEETELDRTVVDELSDPLMHLLRNSADHGLDMPEERRNAGKPAMGSIFINAFQDGNNVIIEVGDDGRGIDVEAVRNKIIERNYLPEERALQMTDKEVIEVLFDPGFSMAKKVTDLSGRGVGLDVVKSKIEALGGDVEVRSKLGEGSTFVIRLPLTLAIIQALMVVVGGEKFAIALGNIQTIEDIPISDVKLVENKEVIQLRGTVIPIIRLSEILDAPSKNDPEANLVVAVVKKGDSLAGLVVDELIGQMEVVIKSLGKYINTSRIISGATILGNGEVALILDSNALF
ncbi:MAG: chemotaxis protein CheA [Lachnospiraceae bacterium]|nr:chemotaxis protein CheA [Lachnospiraceae bacterium]